MQQCGTAITIISSITNNRCRSTILCVMSLIT